MSLLEFINIFLGLTLCFLHFCLSRFHWHKFWVCSSSLKLFWLCLVLFFRLFTIGVPITLIQVRLLASLKQWETNKRREPHAFVVLGQASSELSAKAQGVDPSHLTGLAFAVNTQTALCQWTGPIHPRLYYHCISAGPRQLGRPLLWSCWARSMQIAAVPWKKPKIHLFYLNFYLWCQWSV